MGLDNTRDGHYYNLKHKSGKKNTNADALSRCPADESQISVVQEKEEDEMTVFEMTVFLNWRKFYGVRVRMLTWLP